MTVFIILLNTIFWTLSYYIYTNREGMVTLAKRLLLKTALIFQTPRVFLAQQSIDFLHEHDVFPWEAEKGIRCTQAVTIPLGWPKEKAWLIMLKGVLYDSRASCSVAVQMGCFLLWLPQPHSPGKEKRVEISSQFGRDFGPLADCNKQKSWAR